MITAEEEQDERETCGDMQEVADAVESGIEQIVAALKKLDLKVQVTVPPSEQKTPVVHLNAEIPDIKIPQPQPHPFRYGLTCEVVSRDMNGDIKKFTIKPIKP